MSHPTITLSQIDEGERARNLKNYGDLDSLIDSIKSIGLIEPISLSKRPDGKFDLVAGGRRFRACMKAGITELVHGATLTPGVASYVFADEVPLHKRLEAELDENLHRLGMGWIDEVLLVDKIHKAKRAALGANKWGQAHTAKLLGKGFGQSSVSMALDVAILLRKGDKEILACSSLMEANAVRLKRKEDKALAVLNKRILQKTQAAPVAGPIGTSSVDTSSFLDKINITLNEKAGDSSKRANPQCADASGMTVVPNASPGSESKTGPTVQPSGPVTSTAPVEVPLSKMFTNADSFSDISWPQVDHIVTDIPYGIDMDNLDSKQVVDVKETHDVDQNLKMMPLFLERSYWAVNPGGFCVFFYDLDHHEKLQSWATEIGWKVQRWPLIWHKTHPCQNNAAQYNTTKNYECCMFLRRDSSSVLRKPLTSSVWSGDGSIERKMYNNPFAKPFELWKLIYTHIAIPGQTVLDPFCGEMSACKAAVNCGLDPRGIEISSQHFNRGLEHMRSVYALIHKSNVSFT